jgi:2-dehydropantoate 2-reductase
MKIAVFGTGGVGGLVGGLLAAEGRHEVHFIARNQHLVALQSKGLAVKSTSGDFHLARVLATGDPTAIGSCDLVLVCVKTWQLAEAREKLKPLVDKNTLILPLENGIDATDFLSQTFPPNQVLRGLCAMVSYIEAPGVIRHSGPDPFMAFGESDSRVTPQEPKVARLQKLFDAFCTPRIRLKLPEDILASQWQKFLFIASFGVVTSLVRLPIGLVRGVPKTRQLLEKAMQEVAAIGRALQVALPADAVTRGLALVDEMPADGSTSMQRDFAAGRRTELEAFSGTVCRKGLELGIPTPVHSTCYDLLLPLELKAQAG